MLTRMVSISCPRDLTASASQSAGITGLSLHAQPMVLGFMFKSLIHLELILVFGDRKGSSFCFLHVASRFFQHNLLNMESFPYSLFFSGFVKDQMVVDVWCFFWSLCSVQSVYVSVLVPVPYCFDYCSRVVYFEVWQCDASGFVLFAYYCLGYVGSFLVPHEV